MVQNEETNYRKSLKSNEDLFRSQNSNVYYEVYL